ALGEQRAATVPTASRTRGARATGRGRDKPQREDPTDGGGRAGDREGQRHEPDRAHPVTERGDGLPDEQVPVTLAADESPDAHGVWEAMRSSRSYKMRLRYVWPRGGLAGA